MEHEKKKNFGGRDRFCMCMRSLCACESQQLSGEDKVRVGVAYYNQSDTFLNELIACFKEELQSFESDDLEVTVTVRDAAGSQRTQDDQVKRCSMRAAMSSV